MTFHRRINSPSLNSNIILGPSDIHTVLFPNNKGMILGKSLIEYENIRFLKSNSKFLDVVSGDDNTTEGNFSSNRITVGVQSISIGSDSNSENNIRFHHNGNKSLQFVLGNDTTLENNTSINLALFLGLVPLGTIVFWLGGYFLDGTNNTYNYVLGSSNDVLGVNGYANNYGWYVCDGSALNLVQSPIFNDSGRYLPNLSDSRFLQGYTSVGGVAGNNSNLHTHDVTPQTSVATQPSFTTLGHYHSFGSMSLGNENQSHSHSSGGVNGNTSYAGSHTHHYEVLDNGGFYDSDPDNPGYLPVAQAGIQAAISSFAGDHGHTYSSSGVSVGGESNTHNHALSGKVGNITGQNGDNTLNLTQTSLATVTSSTTTSGPSSVTENRPKYLGGFYLMRVF